MTLLQYLASKERSPGELLYPVYLPLNLLRPRTL
jgi:hypothetical protein